jgi:hypothetical protein
VTPWDSHGIPRRPQYDRTPRLDAQLADTEWLRTRFALGGIEEIAAELHSSTRKVRRALDAAGIERLPATAPIAARADRIIAARDAEWRAVVDRIVTGLGGDPDDYVWPDTEG